MIKFIGKTFIYVILILVVMEVLVRVFHLYTEDPPRYIDEKGVEKRAPKHEGYAVTGNRNQNFSKFHINEFGFNSKREFAPTVDKVEIAIIGDSFIEGFHEDYDNSTGAMLEQNLNSGVEVYEFGYAGYDLANQLHLIDSYKEKFDLIDEIIIYLNYQSDLERDTYEPNVGRIKMLASTPFKIRDNIKLLAYGSKIGVLDPIKNLFSNKANVPTDNTEAIDYSPEEQSKTEIERDNRFLGNFKKLIAQYGFDESKTTLLLDSRKTADVFLEYCKSNNIKYIDFADSFEISKQPTTLIYDRHWNTHGRELIASELAEYFSSMNR